MSKGQLCYRNKASTPDQGLAVAVSAKAVAPTTTTPDDVVVVVIITYTTKATHRFLIHSFDYYVNSLPSIGMVLRHAPAVQ